MSAKQPKTFELQSTLPRLPIPPLKETVERYLETARPLLSPEEFARTKAAATTFLQPGGIGEQLQHRLIDHDKGEKNSWLERWWLQLAYHSWREGLMINSNWYMIARDHPNTPSDLLTENSPARKDATITDFQLHRAAGLASLLLDYKERIDTETLPVDMTRAGPQDMNQYRDMFGITRVPKPECDIIVGKHPIKSKHIVVLIRDQVYTVDVLDDRGSRVPIQTIEAQLKAAVNDAIKSPPQPAIGLFTAIHRDKWADMHKYLEDLSPVNQASFRAIESSIFAISLDDRLLPTDLEYLAKNTFHGMNGHNRWFDKALSLVVMNDGRSGMNGEHSPCDALVPAVMFDWVVGQEPAKDPASANRTAQLQPPKKLVWKVDGKVMDGLKEAQALVDASIKDSDVKLFNFPVYGSDFIKKTAKVSPDAFMQMALQLNYYRLHGKCAAVYETASTRQFLHGRTETCRSLSNDSKAFVQAFDNPQVPHTHKYELLKTACSSHVKYIAVASQGRGVDRHLLGLRMCLKPGESADLFKDPAYARSCNWQLSTSGLFPGERLLGTGFGAVVPDGYGMNYIILANRIKMGVESKASCKETSSQRFVESLGQVLKDMKVMCETGGEGVAKAKL
ncbi:hypothetical protein HDU85_001855 [Gaertneriomyces sp. JEL0708]|nr:hypothetical protein HDU85_001855 [Gaertneriomyces sp. JEL0708]